MTLLHPRPAPSRPAARPRDPAPRSPAAFAVERLDAAAAAAHRDAWVDLAGRALEDNPFLDPDFALPAARHLAGARRPAFAFVWAEAGEGRRDLVGVCGVAAGRGAPLLATAWLHDLATLGFPLLDRERAEGALAALIAWVGRAMGAAGFAVPSLPADGPTAAALWAVAAAEGLGTAVLADWARAALRPGAGPAGLPALSSKNAKELRRQRRRLSERGALHYASAPEGEDLLAATERFLALEAAGWKGAAGTALLCSPGRTAFARTATRLLGRRSLCRVDSLTIDGAPVAMAIVLTAGATDALWKIAYREDVARLSPGVQLVLEITAAQLRPGRAALTDSCAVPDHPMIDRLWRDRIRLCDAAISTRPGRPFRFRAAVAAARGARRLRAGAKRAVLAWRARRRRTAGP